MTAVLQADRLDFIRVDITEPELFRQAVPRALVHRAAISEVLLTGIRRCGEDAFRVGAQWSRGHSYYGAVAGRWHDPMLFAESIRQVGLLLAHEALGIPLGFSFLTKTMSFDVNEEEVRLGRGPAHVVLEVTLHDVVRRRNVVSAYAYDVVGYRDGRRIGWGSVTANCVSASIYHRLRGDRAGATAPRDLPSGISPELVGRTCEFDVVLSADFDNGTRELRADADHPVLFDHPLDHIPGMVLMEAARQAGLAALGLPDALLVGCGAEFHRYVEFDPPCHVSVVSADVDEADRRKMLRVEFEQAGSLAAACEVALYQSSSA
ncbi:ScbA/BarX family gamma-butyrolactone biosynthesis protein [Streptomyces sp. TRM 70361]|uniref:ScbA/BarX family gamma-butyrolactone biosynthesis protein n=1 Tax=Streptomyces sp. TRM 70361 TaxID=3116553 RepID=UPI002E7B9EA3|nr:ScbA/BarX family gamma-butyrolactone biosynthesis protein [Streptomyces sp. TRM 70361]MEE1941972.1 ScbA/BarX family gamma-butyrolactone biosynthesis protein [Streptomyces sp. TRM 70361]